MTGVCLRILMMLLILPGILTQVAIGDPASDRADQVFLKQLTERQFFELAQQHCQHQMDRATSEEGKAEWLLRLSQVYEQHAWFAETASRGELLNLSVEEITEFLQQQSPSPELQFRLRIQQAHVLGQSIRMRLIVAQSGHLFGAFVNKKSSPLQNAVRTEPSQTGIKLIDQSIELTNSLLSQLEQSRRDLDSQMVREIRDDGRFQLAELQCLKYYLLRAGNSPDAAGWLTIAEDGVNLVVRSQRDESRKSLARSLLAELSLHSAAKDEFELRIQSVDTNSDGDAILRSEFLAARGLLGKQEPTAALTLVETVSETTSLQNQHREWLKLESLLGLHELALKLKDATLLSDTSRQFEQQMQRVRQLNRGVFRDAAEVTSQRFTLIAEVGVEIADLVEQVEILREDGKPDEALRLVDLAIQRIPPTAAIRAKAALQLRSGELLAPRGNWHAADDRLQAAYRLYGEGEMVPEQAAADLLHIYVTAQLLQAEPNQSALNEYVESLEKHLARFAEQKTTAQARKWLLDVIEPTDPVRAAALSLEVLKQTSSPPLQIVALERLGKLVLRPYRTTQSTQAVAIVAEFETLANEMREDPDRYPADDLLVINLLSLELQFSAANATDQDWRPLANRLTKLQLALLSNAVDDKRADATDSARLKDAVNRCCLMETVVAARTSTYPQKRAAIQQRLLDTPDTNLRDSIEFLFSHYQNSPVRAGDTWLAGMNEQLLNRLVKHHGTNLPFAEQMRLLQMISKTSSVTEELQLRDSFMAQILKQDISTEQLTDLAHLLSQSEIAGPGAAGSGPRANGMRTSSSLSEFWKRISQQQAQGSELWLESQLQLAQAAADFDRIANAKKLLGVVEAIYPTWGNSDRKMRAAALLQRLSRSQ